VRFLLQYVREKGIETATFGEYARWWKRRTLTKCVVEMGVASAHLDVHAGSTATEDVYLRLSRGPGLEAIIPLSTVVDLERVPWGPMTLTPLPPDIRNIREFDPRSLVGSLYTEMMRKFK